MLLTRALILLLLSLLIGCSDNSTRVQGYVYQEPIYMSSIVEGMLWSLDVERGEFVTAGQTLFSLDPEPQRYNLTAVEDQLKQAESTLLDIEKASRETILEGLRGKIEEAEANLDIARKKAARFEALVTKGAIAIETRDEATADEQAKLAALVTAKANLAEAELGARVDAIKAQQAVVESLKAQVESAKWALAQKTSIAPHDALVVDTFYRPGENIAASKPVLQLFDPERLFAIFFISEPVLSEICLGQDIFVAHDRSKKKTKAVISYISPQAEYTPPVIYSRENNQALVFRIQATLAPEHIKSFHSGQPIDIYLPEDNKCHEQQ